MDERFNDHENRIRKLEESNVRQEMQLKTIETGQVKIENQLLTQSQDMSKSFSELIQIVKGDTDTTNKIRLIDRKEIWGVVGVLIAGFLSILF